MRTAFRLVTSTALGAILVLSLGIGATFASSTDTPTVQVIDLSEDWCFDDTVDLYCNVQTGTLTIRTWPDGSSASTVDMVTTTDVTRDGAFVAKSVKTVKDRSSFGADGSYSTDQRERTTWTDHTQTCVSASHFKRIDFDVKIDTYTTNCD